MPGDFREIQGTMWAHDHRFFFTAENVYKGNLGMVNYYSGPDRGHEQLNDGVNLRLPSGKYKDWGNIDFDVNLVISDAATGHSKRSRANVSSTSSRPTVSSATCRSSTSPTRRSSRCCRASIVSASWPRACRATGSSSSRCNGVPVPVKFIANDGNLLVNPVTVTEMDEMGVAERFDIVVDFSQFPVGSRLYLVNELRMREDGRGGQEALPLRAGFGRPSRRSLHRRDHGVPCRELGAERRCAGTRP